ncbi:uncharacterized protein J3R85_006805 [Psidium guajava]|nr:uncharacterized protein J3R85_006805 [Psidium guajava]
MVEKVTRMLIKVDLRCSRCYMKIKKILCKFPQIRDQMYNEKQNMVLITVVCCSPEKIRQRIICKGGETVQSVEILLDKPKEPEKTKDNKKEPPKETFKEPKPVVGYPLVPMYPMVAVCSCPPFYGGYGGGPCHCGRRRPMTCYDGCGRPVDECQGRNRGSYPGLQRPVMCDDGCGRPVNECQGENRGSYPGLRRPMMCDDGCKRPADECQGGNRGSYPGPWRPVMCDDGCGRLACECQGGNIGYYASRCDYFSEENATACIVM